MEVISGTPGAANCVSGARRIWAAVGRRAGRRCNAVPGQTFRTMLAGALSGASYVPSILGQHVLVTAFEIESAGFAVAMTAVVAVCVGVLPRSTHHALAWKAMAGRVGWNLLMPRRCMRYDELRRKAPAWMWAAAGALVFSFSVLMCYHAYGELEGGVTLESWALHVGFWGCVVGALGIVRGARRSSGRVLRRQSRPDRKARRRLSRSVMPAFQDEQHMFVAPWPRKIKGV